MNKNPKVSVIMSVYNGATYLQESIDSILTQTFKDFEFIIINDCSTDRTETILLDYASHDDRIVLVNNEQNLGLTRSLNKGLAIATGEYIARQDADDIALSDRFEKQAATLERQLKVVLVSCNFELIDADGKLIKEVHRDCSPSILKWHLIFYNHVGGHSQVMFRRQPAITLGGYSENYQYAQDYQLWLRLIKAGDFLILPDKLQRYRFTHTGSITQKFKGKQEEFALLAIQDNIKDLINQEISILEASDLKSFWERKLPPSKNAEVLNRTLKKIYLTFINRETDIIQKHKISCQIQTLIEDRFLVWMQTLISRNQIRELLKISYYALHWNFKMVLYFYFRRAKEAKHRYRHRIISKFKVY
jgi:glycosyltransferase involved in cell wall biosynthesis